MTWWEIIFIISFSSVVFYIFITEVYSSFVDDFPNGRRAKKKFIEKINTIENANRVSNSVAIANKNGKIFKVRIYKGEVPDGLHYSTIPVYTYRSVWINKEEVARIHHIKPTYGKEKDWIELTAERNKSEILEIVDAAYKVAEQTYRDYIHKTFCSDGKSFYTEDKK